MDKLRKIIREELKKLFEEEEILLELTYQEKDELYDKSSQKVPFSMDLVIKAIKEGRELGISFQSSNDSYRMPVSKFRIIWPVALGRSKKGNLVLRALHLGGQSERLARKTGVRSAEASNEWRLFKTSNIKNMWETGRFFNELPSGYNPNDKSMRSVMISFKPSLAKQFQNSELS